MKKITKLLLCIMVIMVTLSACSGSSLKGTYAMEDNAAQLVFSGKNEVSSKSVFGVSKGTYKIKKDKIIITWSDDYSPDEEYEYSYEKSGNTITLDGVSYTKNKK